MPSSRWVTTVLIVACACLGSAWAAEPAPDPWIPLARFIGEWTGVASGEGGDGTVTRQYSRVMNGRFIHEVNISKYPPQEANKSGEVHEHWSMFSYDKTRRVLVLRQFHLEGFVNTYRLADGAPPGSTLMFESESFENFSNAWKARESYEFLSNDEFIETFELAAPGKPFQVYSRNRLTRVRK